MTEAEKARIKKCKAKLARFCAYRERTHQEVKKKAQEIGLYKHEAEELLSELIAENFVSEERFAKVYTRDKFYLNKWGRNKIVNGLRQKNISPHCITSGLKEIDEDDYRQTLQKLYENKSNSVKGDSPAHINQKVSAFLIRKGYEPDMVWAAIKTMD